MYNESIAIRPDPSSTPPPRIQFSKMLRLFFFNETTDNFSTTTHHTALLISAQCQRIQVFMTRYFCWWLDLCVYEPNISLYLKQRIHRLIFPVCARFSPKLIADVRCYYFHFSRGSNFFYFFYYSHRRFFTHSNDIKMTNF